MDDKVSGQHVSQVVAPLLAAFTLPTIAVIVVTPPPHWRYAILSLFVASTGLLLAGFQLSVGRLFHDATPWNEIRAILTFLGLIALASGLAVLAASARREDRGTLYGALALLAAGVLIPIGMNLGLWITDRRKPPRSVNVEQDVLRALKSTDIHVKLDASSKADQALSYTAWDFNVTTQWFPAVMDRLPQLVDTLRPVIAQWNRLSTHWCYMLILPGPIKVNLLFHQPRAISPPWQVTAGTMRQIDDHFWDWMLWLSAKQASGEHDLVAAEFTKLHQHLLAPLGITALPSTLDQAICDYRAARSERESEFGLQVPRAAEQAVIQALRPSSTTSQAL